jgi:hypothetical protein
MLIGMAHTPLPVCKTSEDESRHTGERNSANARYCPSSADCNPAGSLCLSRFPLKLEQKSASRFLPGSLQPSG